MLTEEAAGGGTPNWYSLPRELQVLALASLDLRSVCTAALVSKSWNALFCDDTLWSHLYLQAFGADAHAAVLQETSRETDTSTEPHDHSFQGWRHAFKQYAIKTQLRWDTELLKAVNGADTTYDPKTHIVTVKEPQQVFLVCSTPLPLAYQSSTTLRLKSHYTSVSISFVSKLNINDRSFLLEMRDDCEMFSEHTFESLKLAGCYFWAGLGLFGDGFDIGSRTANGRKLRCNHDGSDEEEYVTIHLDNKAKTIRWDVNKTNSWTCPMPEAPFYLVYSAWTGSRRIPSSIPCPLEKVKPSRLPTFHHKARDSQSLFN